MRRLQMTYLLLLLCTVAAGPAAADIYIWTDSGGIKHITNYAPPADAQVLIRTPEIAHDAAADRRRQEDERRRQLAREKLALAEREAQLAAREREANARIAAAEQLARELRAHQKDMDAQGQQQAAGHRTYWYQQQRRHQRSFYRENGNIYYRRRPHPQRAKATAHRERTHPIGPQRVAGTDSGSRLHEAKTGPRMPQPSGRYPDAGPYVYRRR